MDNKKIVSMCTLLSCTPLIKACLETETMRVREESVNSCGSNRRYDMFPDESEHA